MALAIARVSIGCWTFQCDLIYDLGQLLRIEVTQFLAEFEFLMVGDVLSVFGEEAGRSLLLALLHRLLHNTKNTDRDSDVHIREVVLHHFLEGPLQLLRNRVDPRIVGIVGLTVIPNELQIIEHLLHPPIAFFLQLPQHSRQVHRTLNNRGVVGKPHALPIHRLPEVKRLVGLVETVDDDA